ncbi:MAG: TolC family protein [Sulfuritalea sp.]|nr:TolC family protein [Sulfuritalea sp.]
MHQATSCCWRNRVALAATLFLSATQLWAQSPPPSTTAVNSLKQAYETAWARQPEAQSLNTRREAASARREAADSWLAEPLSIELSDKTDQLNHNQGMREYQVGLAIPLWLPGERTRTAALADAESRMATSRALAAQLRVAASIREAWWLWQRAQGEQALARERLTNAQQLADDVARRVKAGALARSDQHQAEGAAASAEMALSEAEAALAAATQQLRAMIGATPDKVAAANMEDLPEAPADFAALDTTHPAVIELFDRAEVARKSADLADSQSRANPELTLATTRDRSVFGDSWQQSITLGIRIPFGSESRQRAKVGTVRAEAIEAEAQLRIERERLIADLEATRVRVASAQNQLKAAEKRATLARESRSFFEKSFRLGETDLPTRLRIELDAVDAERQMTRTRIELAAAISAFRQAMGLLPE